MSPSQTRPMSVEDERVSEVPAAVIDQVDAEHDHLNLGSLCQPLEVVLHVAASPRTSDQVDDHEDAPRLAARGADKLGPLGDRVGLSAGEGGL